MRRFPATHILAALVLVLTVGLPLTMPSRATIGRMDGVYLNGLAPGWTYLIPDETLGEADGISFSSVPDGDGPAQRIEAAEGASLWLVTAGKSVSTAGASEGVLVLDYVFQPSAKGALRVGMVTYPLREAQMRLVQRTIQEVPPGEGPVEVHIPLAGIPSLAGLAIGVEGPGTVIIRDVRFALGRSGANEAYGPALWVWGVDTSPPWIRLSGKVIEAPSAPGAGIGHDPKRQLAVMSTWALVLLAAMCFLAVRDYRLATVTLIGSLAVALVEPAPFELLFFAWLVVGLFQRQFRADLSKRNPRLALGLALVLGLACFSLVSWFAGGGGLSSFIYLAKTLYVLLVGVALAAYTSGTDRLRAVLYGLVLAALISVGGLLVAGLLPGSLLPGDSGAVGGAMKGFMKDKNVFGPFQVLGLIALWSLRDRFTGAGQRWMVPVAAGVGMALASVLSLSRAAWVSLVIAIVALLAAAPASSRRPLLWGVVGLVAVLLGLFLCSPDVLNSLAKRFGIQAYDLSSRFPMHLDALGIGLANPLGVGPRFFEQAFSFSVHNVYLRLLAENGWLSLVSYLGLLLWPLVSLWPRRASYGVLGLMVCILVLAVNGLVIDTLHWRFFWVILGAAWGCALGREDTVPDAKA